MDEQDGSACWLCGTLTSVLTREHTPPRSAYNSGRVILQRPSDQAIELGYLAWKEDSAYLHGHFRRSLCERCNSLGGRAFVPAYSDFVHQVAQKVSTRIPLTSIEVEAVRNPQLILRQILLQLVTSNGPKFVEANNWIRPFLLTRKPCRLPDNVHLYIFATQNGGMRSTGLTGQILLDKETFRVFSEFTHWPLGTILSFSELVDEPLLCITDWSEIPFRSKNRLTLKLPVNPTVSPCPLDFRDDLGILLDMNKPGRLRMDEQLALRIMSEMQTEVNRRSGDDSSKRILTGRRLRPAMSD